MNLSAQKCNMAYLTKSIANLSFFAQVFAQCCPKFQQSFSLAYLKILLEFCRRLPYVFIKFCSILLKLCPKVQQGYNLAYLSNFAWKFNKALFCSNLARKNQQGYIALHIIYPCLAWKFNMASFCSIFAQKCNKALFCLNLALKGNKACVFIKFCLKIQQGFVLLKSCSKNQQGYSLAYLSNFAWKFNKALFCPKVQQGYI